MVWNNYILVIFSQISTDLFLKGKLKLNLKVRIIRLFCKKNSELHANLQSLEKELKIKFLSRKLNLLKYYF